MIKEKMIAPSIKAGNVEAFQEFYQTYYRRLLNYASMFIQQTDEAEDIVQEAFYNLWKNRQSIEPAQSLVGLLYTAIRNQCLNKIKHNKVHDKFIDFAKNYEAIDFVYRHDFDLKADDDHFFVMSEILKAIDQLPEKRKQVYKLSKIEGASHHEIAQQLDISTKGVERHMTLANKSLREKLKHLKTAMFILSILP